MLKEGVSIGRLHAQWLQVCAYAQTLPLSIWVRSISTLLLVLLAYTLAQWVWLLLPLNSPPVTANNAVLKSSATTVKNQTVDIAKLQSFNIFGAPNSHTEPSAPAVVVRQEVLDADPTRLKLVLNGVIQSNNSDDALAIIFYQGKEDQYAIGDSLPVARVTVSQIHADHIIIENAGRYESLWLFNENESSTSLTETVSEPNSDPLPVATSRRDMRSNVQVSAMAQDYRERLYSNPNSLAEVVRIAPQQDKGEMRGYRISPGSDKAQFEQLGLQTGDVVTRINDIDLDDPAKAVELYKIMRSATEASVVIDRDGEIIELQLTLQDND